MLRTKVTHYNQMYPLVSMVLLNYNGIKYLGNLFRKCLDSIMATDYPNLEMIFVDNGSTDGSDLLAKKFLENFRHKKNLKTSLIISNKENIIARGYNKGIQSSKGDYIALLSNDMVYDSQWLRSIIEEMEKDPLIGIAGCKRYVYGTSDIIDGLGGDLCIDGRSKIPGGLEKDSGQYENCDEMDWIGGAAVIRREVLKQIGLFDPDYQIFYEDTDLCCRAHKIGYRVVYVPKAKLWHRATSTINSALAWTKKAYLGERSRIRFVLIHFALLRILSTFLIDLIVVLADSPTWKIILLRAYWWNVLNLSFTLKRRLNYGLSPQYNCKYPLFLWSIANRIKKLPKKNANNV